MKDKKAEQPESANPVLEGVVVGDPIKVPLKFSACITTASCVLRKPGKQRSVTTDRLFRVVRLFSTTVFPLTIHDNYLRTVTKFPSDTYYLWTDQGFRRRSYGTLNDSTIDWIY
jgi:hypothetical protein